MATLEEIALGEQLRVVTVGNVDHGKSTLIGRLLHDTGNLPDGKVAELRIVSDRRGVPFEWSFVLDALQSERDQAITIDTTRIWLRLPEREIVLIDAPGHEEFLRNMVTGASDADAALLVVDAAEGVGEQTRRHALLLELLGVKQVVAAINKMDRVAYSHARYLEIRTELTRVLAHIGVTAAAVVPSAARDGDNIVAVAETMPWYDGATIVRALLGLTQRSRDSVAPFRMAVQGVVRQNEERIVTGRIEAGTLRIGDEVAFAPGARRACVTSFATWPFPNAKRSASAGESVGFTLDAQLFVERGDVAAQSNDIPAPTNRFRARLLWLGTRTLRPNARLKMRVGTRLANVEIERFERIVDLTTLAERDTDIAETNDVVDVVVRSRETLALDTVERYPGLGRFILIDGLDVVAGGTIRETFPLMRATDVVAAGHLLGPDVRAARNGHRGAVVWLTGLPGAGKSTIAMALERRLFERGLQTYVLDGDNLRAGLNRDLAFSDADRAENVRRLGEVAALFADAGVVTVVAAISPTRAGRAEARGTAGDRFVEVHVATSASVCETRDPKGHYAKARAGELPGFTGIAGTYEAPLDPDIAIDTETLSLDDAVTTIVRALAPRIALDAEPLAAI